MGYYLEHPDSLFYLVIDLIGLSLFLIGLIKLIIIIKNQVTYGPGINNKKELLIAILLFLIGLLFLVLAYNFGFTLLP